MLTCVKFTETERDICLWFEVLPHEGTDAVIEKVHAMPKQGIASTFKFGQSYGFLRGMLIAHKVSFKAVAPGIWQRSMSCLTKGDKKVTYRRAQELFPQVKVTHAIADALLIAEYARFLYYVEQAKRQSV